MRIASWNVNSLKVRLPHVEQWCREAQPDVLAALHSVKFAKVVRRSIHLTPFGEEFCKLALVDEAVASSSDLPEHEAPPEIDGQ